MDIASYLKDYAAKAQICLDSFFDEKIKEVEEIGQGEGKNIAKDMLFRYKAFSTGGKKLRGALIQLGFELGGGKKEEVLEASTSIEIIHSFLLMHDDIEDKDSLRRGSPTIHKQYEKILGLPHYGVSMGINMGDLGAYLGMEVLLKSQIADSNKLKAATYLSRMLQRVAYGQALDVTFEQSKHITEKNVLEVHLNKTSIYTIEGPLKIGALLAGAKNNQIKAIEGYGEPVGIAYQLRDDELGLFGDEKTLGKPVGSDIREGKNTILKIKALEKATPSQRKFLTHAYGNKNITKKDVEKVKNLTIQTGSFAYSQKLSQKLVKKGKTYIPKITKNKKLQQILDDGADFVITRDS